MKWSFAVLLVGCCLLRSAAQESREAVSVPEETMQALLIHRVKPAPDHDAAHILGEVVLKAGIDKSGSVESLELITGHPMLVPRAIDAAKQWKYRPYEVNGIAVPVKTTIRIEFSEASGPAPSDSISQSPVSVTSGKMGGHIIRKVPPIYPPLARQARIQGTVILRVIIDKEGNVSNLQMVSGHPMLAPAAIEAVRQWKYTPYELDGEIVEVDTTVQVNFVLADDPPHRGVPYAPDPGAVLPGGVPGGVIAGVLSSNPSPALEGERVSEAVMRPLRIQKIDPIYPGVAIQSKLQGTVVLDVRVNSSGGVDKVVHMSGPLTLAPAAIVAVKQWRYTPYVKDGQAIAVVSPVRLKFSLEENENGVVSEPEPSEDASPQKIALPRIAVPQRVRVSSGVSSGLLVKRVAPAYPPEARDAHIQGIVVLQANIDKEGSVSNLVLVSGDPMLAPAAIEAVQQWKYRPYLLNGQAVEVETTIHVNFVLTP